MKVIFTQTVENNNVGDIKDVADGYARNYLIPKEMAIPATPNEIKNIEKRLEKIKKEEAETVKKLEEVRVKLEKIKLEVEMEVGDKDDEGNQTLFGSVNKTLIEEELTKKGFEIDKKQIETGETIKHLGDYEITVKLGHGVDAKITLKVKENKK